MSQDRKKLMQILKNLERDYDAGLISEEKYIYLSDQYKHKIETIEVSDRIRAMQGKEETPSSLHHNETQSEEYRQEKEKLVRKFIHNPETFTTTKKAEENSPHPDNPPPRNTGTPVPCPGGVYPQNGDCCSA